VLPLANAAPSTESQLPLPPWHAVTLPESLMATAFFGLLGLALLLLGYKIFEWITPKLDIEKELAEKNMAVAIVVGAIFISIGLILARAIGG